MRVLVTVGTTYFDELINRVLEVSVIEALVAVGCHELVIQYGSTMEKQGLPGKIVSFQKNCKMDRLSVTGFDFINNLAASFAEYDAIISHGGVGTILELLEARTTSILIANPNLTDNHQVDIINKMCENGQFQRATLFDLPEAINTHFSSITYVHQESSATSHDDNHLTPFVDFIKSIL